MSLRETHSYDINDLSDKEKFKLLSTKALDYIDQYCNVSIRLDGVYIPPSLRQLLDHQVSPRSIQNLNMCVNTQDTFTFETFKQCVTTFLSRERLFDEINNEHGNWTINDQSQTTVITGYVFNGIQEYDVPEYVFQNQAHFIRFLQQQHTCLVTLACESSVVKLSSKLTVTLIHESSTIRHLAAAHMKKTMIAAVTQCETYHIDLILHQSTSSSMDAVGASIASSDDPPRYNDIFCLAASSLETSSSHWIPPISHSVLTYNLASNGINHNQPELDQRRAHPFHLHGVTSRVLPLQNRLCSYGISIGAEYSRITSILNIPPSISITESVREQIVAKKKQWNFSLLLDGDLILADVWDWKKNEAKRRAYDSMIHLLQLKLDQ